MTDQQARPEPGAIKLGMLLWQGPGLLVFLFFSFVVDWWCTRNWKVLLPGLPAVFVGVATLVILLLCQATSQTERLQVYNKAAMAAAGREDFEAAEVYYRRMALLDESAQSTIFGQAVLALRQEDVDRARALMQQIAPEDSEGHPEAHFWLATDMLAREARLSPPLQRILEHHLKHALAAPQIEADARFLLSKLHMSQGDAESAISRLEELVSQRPELDLVLAQLYAGQNRVHSARTAAKRASVFYQRQVKAEPDEPRHRHRWAFCEMLQKNYAQAVVILQDGLASADPQPFRNALVATYLKWHVAVVKEENGNSAKQLELLNRALIYGPNDARVLTLLADLATREWKGADEARVPLQQILAQGTAPATVHMVLGTRALEKGDLENAQMHLELANEHNPRMPLVLNNLAWVLAQLKEPDLPRALQMAEAARKLSDHPQIHHTLGTILARAGKHREAVTALEISLRSFPGRREIHTQLAELYEHLGNSELADQHRRQEELSASEARLPRSQSIRRN